MGFLLKQGFTNAQVQVMSKGLKTAHIWGKEDIVEGLYQWKMGKQLYEYQQKKLWRMFPMPSLTAMKENTDKHQVRPQENAPAIRAFSVSQVSHKCEDW